ncbi:hypothetical protein Tco_1052262 [Tanacetum coccineum]
MHYECYYSRINQGEVKVALKKMGRNKAVGPDQIPIEAWRSLEDEGIKWLTCLFNKTFSSAKMPDEWRLSEVIPIYKNKGDAQACSNYRGIKLLSHSMKLWERVIERSLMEKYRERQRDLYMDFLDLEKAYDSVPHDIVLIAESAKGLNNRLERWRKALEDNGLRVSREKTEYLRCDFGRHEIGKDRRDVDHRIRAGWMKWRAALGSVAIMKAQATGWRCREMRILMWICSRQDEGRKGCRWFGIYPCHEETSECRLQGVEAVELKAPCEGVGIYLDGRIRLLKLVLKELLLSRTLT